MATWLLAVALALSPSPVSEPLTDAPPPPAAEQILALPDPMRDQFREWERVTHGGPTTREQDTLERMVGFLFDARGLGLTYQFDANYTVGEVYSHRKVNCLSFTLTAIALARSLGMRAYAQEIQDVLTWYQEGNTVYRSNHVNAGIRLSRQRYTVDVAWDEVMTRQEPAAISDEHLYALFYNNRAVELLAKGRVAEAKSYLARAIALDSEYAPFWNNSGVLAFRQGRMETAEADYLKALANNKVHSPALFNLASLYRRSGRQAQAAALEKELEKIRAHDPFDQFLMALENERRGDYAAAITHYRRAIRLYDGEHRFYEGLARAYLHQGDARRAGRALEQARALISDAAKQAQYQAKAERRRNKEIEGQRLFGPDPRPR